MPRSLRIVLAIATAASAIAVATAAQAGITVVNGAFIIPTHSNDFEDIGPHAGYSDEPWWSGPYTQGGITVQSIGGGDKVVTTYQHEGLYSWYDGSGLSAYTRFTLADGGIMNAFQFDATTLYLQPSGAYPPFYYELRLQGSVVATGSGGALCDFYNVCFKTYGFQGGLFDEVRIQSNVFDGWFNPDLNGANAMLFDNIFAREVPEPASWAMMIAGLGIVGSAMRRQRRRALPA